jgi:hypothetical protein
MSWDARASQSSCDARWWYYFSRAGGPAQAYFVGRLVVLALRHVLRAAVVEAEDLVVQVQALHLELQAAIDACAHLRVHLEMRVEVVVAAGSVDRAVERSPGLGLGPLLHSAIPEAVA